MIKWEIINKSKKHGGLGIKNIQTMNISLLCKWWWKLEMENGLWQEIIKGKYLHNDTVGSVKHRMDDSPIWRDLLKIKHIYLKGRIMKVKNGKCTSFWTDTWLCDKPLCSLSPSYLICVVTKPSRFISFFSNMAKLTLIDG